MNTECSNAGNLNFFSTGIGEGCTKFLIGIEDGSKSIAAIRCDLRLSNFFSILLEAEEKDSEHVPGRK
jgi:hypothetical protein